MTISSLTTNISAQHVLTARAADGDYKTRGVGHEIKDADGDYKQTSAPPALQAGSTSVAASRSSNGVLAALVDLTKGGA